jgi:hypothetical protein
VEEVPLLSDLLSDSRNGNHSIPAVAATAGSDNKRTRGREVIATEGTLQCSYCALISSILFKLVEARSFGFTFGGGR